MGSDLIAHAVMMLNAYLWAVCSKTENRTGDMLKTFAISVFITDIFFLFYLK